MSLLHPGPASDSERALRLETQMSAAAGRLGASPIIMDHQCLHGVPMPVRLGLFPERIDRLGRLRSVLQIENLDNVRHFDRVYAEGLQ